jgi:eukaryotic-like serine/threonine-protein kinase
MAAPGPTKIGKYDVIGVIGRGGMGVVYQGKDPQLDRLVAIKMIVGVFAEHPDMLKRFFREAQSLGSLQHPNIVTVFDLGDYGGNPYLVMEYLEGEGLDHVLSNRRQLSLLEKLSIVIQVSRGLAYAHRRGVIHRDIKPANIMLGKDGGVKIFDFGIAHAGDQNVTRTGQVMGTLRYMAPEQFNSKTVDSRTDIFSTGVVLYQLLTNHLPFEAENTATTMFKIVHEPPPLLSNFLSAYPAEMEQILQRALAKNPEDRYSSADDLALDLEQLQGQLKDELIGRELQEVSVLLDRGEVQKAQSSLVRVLKVDQQHSTANRMLREVQQRIQREEIGKQVRELRQRAEDALADEQFANALEHADRALALDRNNTDLQQLRETVSAAASHAEKLQNALKAAEAAQAEGKLDEAREAAEAALAVAPADTQARMLHRLISRDIETRSRHVQVEGYLAEARQEISSRKFTAALEILKRAEDLDPAVPQVQSLMESAVAGQQQERRRRELEALTREVEEALNADDYGTACHKADEGLARFPDDRNLLKLKAMADKQRQVEKRRRVVDEMLVEARMLIQAGRNEELLEKLERAISEVGAEPRLQSLLTVVSENVQRERKDRQRSEGLRNAKQSLNNQAFDAAIQTLEELAKEIGDDVDVQDLLVRARSEQVDAVQGALSRAEHESGLELRANILEEALRKSPQDARLKEQLNHVRNLMQVISEIAGAAQKLEEARQYDRALAKWETLSTVYPQYPDLNITIKHVRGLRDRAHTDARQHWIDRIETALSSCDYAQASALAGQANQEFRVDSDLMDLAEKAEVAIRQRAKAQKMLAEGRQSFANQQWEAGAQTMLRAYQLASQDSLIRDQAVNELAQASRATIEKNWQASELILRRLAEIQPSAASSPELQATIQERRREEAVSSGVDAARKKQASGDWQGALRELEQALVWYPEDRRLRDLQRLLETQIQQAREATRLEEIRREKEAFVLDALSRAQQAFVLDKRVQILEEALGKYPQETRLQQQLSEARELRSRVASLVNDARNLEQSRQYGEALAKWEALAAAYRDYPGLAHILEQARQRHQQARLESKANYVKMLQVALSSAEFKRAEEVLAQAKRDFSGDRELAEIEKRVREGIANRAQAEKALAGAAKAAEKEKWKKALESFQEANAAAKSDPVIRGQVVKGLLSAAEAALQSDGESSEMLVAEAARVEPESPLLNAVRSKIETWKRGQFIEQCLSAARRCLSAGDWQGALRSLDRGLAAYPTEPRLLERKERLEGEIRRRDEESRAKELREREARAKELQDKAHREEEQRRQREQELRLQEERNKEARERELREQERRNQELRDKGQRERELREEKQRAEARALEQSRRVPVPPGPEDVSATRIFSQGMMHAAPEASAHAASPVPTPNIAPNTPANWNQHSPPLAPTSPFDTRLTQHTPAPADVLVQRRGQARDTTAFEKVDMPASFEGGLTHIQPGPGSDELHEASLHLIERQLAAFIGPLAKVLVKRAAGKTTSTLELYTILAAGLEREDDRKAFLAKRTELAHGKATAPSSTSAPAQAGTSLTTSFEISSSGEITPAVIEQAARRLAAHLGPIANVLARKEAKRAATLRNFYELLSVHVANPTERERFLKEAGVQ